MDGLIPRLIIIGAALVLSSCATVPCRNSCTRGYWVSGDVAAVLVGRMHSSENGDQFQITGKRIRLSSKTGRDLVCLVEDCRAHGDGLQVMADAFIHVLLLGSGGEVRTWVRFNRDGETVSIVRAKPTYEWAACRNRELIGYGMELVRSSCSAEFGDELRQWDQIANNQPVGRLSKFSGVTWSSLGESVYEGSWQRIAP